jgi:hypothetical protein
MALLLIDGRSAPKCDGWEGWRHRLGFDVVDVVVGFWRAEGCQHEHASCAGTCSDGDVDGDDDGSIIAASH